MAFLGDARPGRRSADAWAVGKLAAQRPCLAVPGRGSARATELRKCQGGSFLVPFDKDNLRFRGGPNPSTSGPHASRTGQLVRGEMGLEGTKAERVETE